MKVDDIMKVFRAYKIDETSISTIHDIIADIVAVADMEVETARNEGFQRGYRAAVLDGTEPDEARQTFSQPEPDLMNLPRFA